MLQAVEEDTGSGFVVLTSLASLGQHAVEEDARNGFDKVLAKPVDWALLKQALREVPLRADRVRLA